MLILINSEKLDFQFSLSQPAIEIQEGLRAAFIDSFGAEVFSRASKVIVVEENFHNVIKDRYGPILIGEHNDSIYNLIDNHLSV
tara:strand:- start:15309 stop:15560 length:252 start_codon:yes stop_codon:yes gene_type:complete